jgi:UDP-N-acetylmuramate: L-alanyl-gamma-D-glutamyl-meso-diaminopimelate ligase
MGSLAGLLKARGLNVRGSDENIYPPISTMLESLEIPILKGYKPENLDPPADLVVVGNVVGRSNPEVQALLEKGLPYMSMPQALGEFVLSGRHPVVVAGTHGKTSTAALMSHVLRSAGRDPTYFVGGVMLGEDRSFRLGSGGHVVIEGDEYETSFFDKGPKLLHYRPRTAILTSIEYDHAEMYPDLQAIEEAFGRFVDLIPEDGMLVACAGSATVDTAARRARTRTLRYGLRDGDLLGRLEETGPPGTVFTAMGRGGDARFTLPQTGNHNLLNALGVIAAARGLGLTDEEIAGGLATFRGVRRRQEIVGEEGGVTVIDDFAHHPTAVRETIGGTRSRFPGRRVWAIFEPRTNTTRRKVFQDAYAEAFDQAHISIIAAVDRPERAPAGNRLDVNRLVEALRSRGLESRHIPDAESIAACLGEESAPGDVVLIMSNGSFGGLHRKMLTALAERADGRRPPAASPASPRTPGPGAGGS